MPQTHGSDRNTVEIEFTNRRSTFKEQPKFKSCRWLRQVHGVAVVERDAQDFEEIPEADAQWTRIPGVSLGIKTADCVPWLLHFEPKGPRGTRWIAAIHAGWRSGLGGIFSKVMEATVQRLGPMPEGTLQVWFGPRIGPCCFQVGAEVVALGKECLRFAKTETPWWTKDEVPGKFHVNLLAHYENQIRSWDPISDGRIRLEIPERVPECTVCAKQSHFSYYSYRREGSALLGSNYSVITMK